MKRQPVAVLEASVWTHVINYFYDAFMSKNAEIYTNNWKYISTNISIKIQGQKFPDFTNGIPFYFDNFLNDVVFNNNILKPLYNNNI